LFNVWTTKGQENIILDESPLNTEILFTIINAFGKSANQKFNKY